MNRLKDEHTTDTEPEAGRRKLLADFPSGMVLSVTLGRELVGDAAPEAGRRERLPEPGSS